MPRHTNACCRRVIQNKIDEIKILNTVVPREFVAPLSTSLKQHILCFCHRLLNALVLFEGAKITEVVELFSQIFGTESCFSILLADESYVLR